MSVISPLFTADTFALSPAQERMWFLDQLDPGTSLYNIAVGLRLSGALDVPALARSLNEIVRRHETLRTRFAIMEGLPRQIIAPTLALALPLADLGALPEPRRAAEVERLAQIEARQSFDLALAPLIRVRLLRLHTADHLLVVTAHHIVSDGWSMGIFMSELSALYAAFTTGQPAPLPELPVQYADYAAWQRDWLASPDSLADQLSYWGSRLGGSLPVLELPADHPRPPVQSLRGANHLFELSPDLTAELQALCRSEGVTLFMLFLAALQTLLFRYTGQSDQLIGTPITNRPHPELEVLIGLFVNTLVLRQDLSDDPSFRDLAKRVRDTCLEAYTRQDVPFEKLVELLQPQRDLSHSPLFQVMLAQQAPAPALVLGTLHLRRMALDTGTAKFDLTLFMEDEEHTIQCKWEYNRDLFEPETIARLTEHFHMLLAGIVRDPGQRLSRLPLLSAAERRQILTQWNAPQAEPLPDGCLPALFEAQVESTPTAIALIDKDRQLTYQELNQRANQLAHLLRARGVGEETLVAVSLPRSADLIVALLGILKAGGHYMPLDPSYPVERVTFMLEDSRAAVVIVAARDDERRTMNDEPALSSFVLRPSSFVDLQIIDLDAERPTIAGMPVANPPRRTIAEQLAFVLYTSGSTGRPKGVAVTQRGVLALIRWARQVYGPDELRRVLATTSLNFDISVYEIFLPLSMGGTVVLAENALALMELDQSIGVTLVNGVPSALAELVRLGGIPASVRTVNLAGEPLGRKLVDQLYAAGVERVYNLYGPTEDTIYSTFALLPQHDSRPPAIGRPIGGTQAYVLDRHLEPVPVGVPGELHLGGAGLARGYLRRPDLTAERFVPNPFAEVSGIGYRVFGAEPSDTRYLIPDTRLYKTGDLVRYRPDSMIEYLGRIDQQVKIRGFRIELGEIEAVLAQHPRLRACAVAAPALKPGERQLVAYVVPTEGKGNSRQQPAVGGQQPADGDQTTNDEGRRTNDESEPSSSVLRPSSLAHELRAFLHSRLPDYMLPSGFVVLDALPLTPNGKLDRRALPVPKALQRETSAPFIAPRTPVETELAGIWVGVLGVERVGVEDNFFELGGHSLLATQIIGQVHETFHVNLPLRSLFEQPTIAHLARLIDTSQPAVQKTEVPRIRPVPRRQRNMNELLDQLDQLSDEEVAALLAQRANKRQQQ